MAGYPPPPPPSQGYGAGCIGLLILALFILMVVLPVGYSYSKKRAFDGYLDTLGTREPPAKHEQAGSSGRKMALIISASYRDCTNKNVRVFQNLDPVSIYNDAKAIHDYLKSDGFSPIWLRDDKCTHLPTGMSCSACRNEYDHVFAIYPSASNIKSALKKFASASKPNDLLWLVFVGCGQEVPHCEKQPHRTQEPCILPVDYLQGGGTIRDGWFRTYFRDFINPKAKTVAIFDGHYEQDYFAQMFGLPYYMPKTMTSWQKSGDPNCKDGGFFLYLSGISGKDKRIRDQGLFKSIVKNMWSGKTIADFKPSVQTMGCTVRFDPNKVTFKQMCKGKVPVAA